VLHLRMFGNTVQVDGLACLKHVHSSGGSIAAAAAGGIVLLTVMMVVDGFWSYLGLVFPFTGWTLSYCPTKAW